MPLSAVLRMKSEDGEEGELESRTKPAWIVSRIVLADF